MDLPTFVMTPCRRDASRTVLHRCEGARPRGLFIGRRYVWEIERRFVIERWKLAETNYPFVLSLFRLKYIPMK